MTTQAPEMNPTKRIDRINRAMLFGGFSCFALLYCVQPLMPLLARQFVLTPSQSSWSLSASTLALALSLVLSGALSDRIGRKQLMTWSLLAAAVLVLLSACAQTYPQLLAARALLGFALGGMPAVAMAYLSEEIEPAQLGGTMGLYIAGTAAGGMAGRVASSFISDHASWRAAFAVMGVLGIYAAWEFARNLPESRRFKQGRPGLHGLVTGARGHLADSGLPWLFALSFLLMGVFVSLYNYIGYRLLAGPHHLSQSVAGSLSVLYLIGTFSSVWAGRLADRIGRRNVLWMVMLAMLAGLLLTLSNLLVLIVAGMALFTFSFFAAHTVASSWVGRRATAPQALASAMYLFFYYLGSSALAPLCGLVWTRFGWDGVVGLLALALGLGVAIALRLRTLAPRAEVPAPGATTFA